MQMFRSIQDEDVAASIGHARKRLVYVAPGVSAAIAVVLAAYIERRSLPIMIVLDANEEFFRLGYCDALSVAKLMETAKKNDISIRRQPGLRLGLLMADDEVLISTTDDEPVLSLCKIIALAGSPTQSSRGIDD